MARAKGYRRKKAATKRKRKYARRPSKRSRKKSRGKRSRKYQRRQTIRIVTPASADYYTKPWLMWTNYATTEEQAKAQWMREYNAGRKPFFSEYYERTQRGEKVT